MLSTLFQRENLLKIAFFAGGDAVGWFLLYFKPAENAGNWLAALAAAFVARFFRPQMPVKLSLAGWLIGFIVACLFAPDLVANGGIWILKRSESIYAVVALGADLVVLLIAWAVRVLGVVGKHVEESPGQAFDEGLEKVEKVTTVYMRIKAPLLDLISFVSTLFKKKP